MSNYRSTKIYDGFSTCFRQWKAVDTHCQYLHGYSVSLKITYEGDLDGRNWVVDFGRAKRSGVLIDGMNLKEWLNYMLDHTVIMAEDDPSLEEFKQLDNKGVIQLRIIPATGAEKFAEYIYNKLNTFVQEETDGRVRVTQVEFMEHNKNSAIYEGEDVA